MAEKFYGSPSKASSYAQWTRRNVWYEHDLHTQDAVISKQNDQQRGVDDNIHVATGTEDESGIIAAGINKIDTPVLINEDEEIRKNVWSDVDDELYITNLIKDRTSNEKRYKRDSLSDSEFREKVVNSVKLDNNEMWEIEPTDLTECDCVGPPPDFLLPPPPRPPFLQADYYCGDDPIPDLETCDTEPVSIFFINL